LVLELVKAPPPSGEEERPEVELADPVLALSNEEAEDEEVADDTPEDDPIPEKTWEYASRGWSLLSHNAKTPLRESMLGVGDAISPDFCLTITHVARAIHVIHVSLITWHQDIATSFSPLE